MKPFIEVQPFIERDHLGQEVRQIAREDMGAAQVGAGYITRFKVDRRWLTSRYTGGVLACERFAYDINSLRLAGVTGSLWVDGEQIAGHSDPIREAEPSLWERICV